MTRITNLDELKLMVDGKKSVVCPTSCGFCRPKPAAFIINLSGAILLRLFNTGMYIYEKMPESSFFKRDKNEQSCDTLPFTETK